MKKKIKPLLYIHRLTIPFHDVDIMEIVWHGNYVRYLEQARCAWLADMGYTYLQWRADGIVYPVAHIEVKYLKSAKFDEEIAIEIYLKDCETALRLDYIIKNTKDEVLTKASTLQMAVSLAGETFYQVHEPLQTHIKRYLENKTHA